MAGPSNIDFVPALCEAHRIANCILNDGCTLAEFEFPAHEVYFTQLRDDQTFGLAAIQILINDLDACFLAALALAFAEAGCVMPAIPDPPDPGEILDAVEECLNRVEESVQEYLDDLGAWSKALTVTFGEDGLPTRITVP